MFDGLQQKKENSEIDDERVFPLIIHFNPGFPNITHILHSHKYIFDLDHELKKVIKLENICVSYKGNPTLQDIFVHSKLPKLDQDTQPNEPQQTPSQGTTAQKCNIRQGACLLLPNLS